MSQRLFSFLHFTRKERNGTVVLLLLCILVFAYPEIGRHLNLAETTDFSLFRQEIRDFRDSMNNQEANKEPTLFYFNPNTASAEDFVRLGLTAKVASMICKYRDKGGSFRHPEDFKKIWGLAPEDFERLLPFIRMEASEKTHPEKEFATRQVEQFAFDPNTASESDFLRLGLPKWTIKSILNYRSKGGKFRSKQDFGKIYNLPEADYARLEPYIAIAAPAVLASLSQPTNAPKWPAKKPVDINRADAEAWKTLPGIGEKRALQMVNYRDKLGGFLSVEQVAQMYNLPDSVFQSIKPFLVIETREIRKIDLNSVSAQTLAAHPYFSKKQAELIVNYRLQHGNYHSVDDIEKIIAFTDKGWLAKVKGYLEVL